MIEFNSPHGNDLGGLTCLKGYIKNSDVYELMRHTPSFHSTMISVKFEKRLVYTGTMAKLCGDCRATCHKLLELQWTGTEEAPILTVISHTQCTGEVYMAACKHAVLVRFWSNHFKFREDVTDTHFYHKFSLCIMHSLSSITIIV